MFHKWRLKLSPERDFTYGKQTLKHVVEQCAIPFGFYVGWCEIITRSYDRLDAMDGIRKHEILKTFTQFMHTLFLHPILANIILSYQTIYI